MKLKNKDFIFSISLGIVLVIAFFLRFYHLGSRPLYGDEAFHTVEIAASSPGKIIRTNFGSILYPLLLHPLLPLGKTEFMARFPAALFGFLCVWIIYLLGKQIFGKKEGIIAAFLSMVSIYMIRFSQTARGYTGLVFFSMLSLYFFYRALEEKKMSFWLAYVLANVLGIYMNFFSLIIIPVHVFFVSVVIIYERILKKGANDLLIARRDIISFVLSIFSILILTFFFYLPEGKGPGTNLFSLFESSLSSVVRMKTGLNPISIFSKTLERILTYRMWPSLCFIHLAFFAIGIIACIKNHKKALALFFAYLSLPILLYILSNPRPPFNTPANYSSKFIFFLPIIFLLMAKGISALHFVSVRIISSLAKIKNQTALSQGFGLSLVLGILILEGALIYAHNADDWNFFSLKRNREIDTLLHNQVTQKEMICFDDSPNKNTFVFIQPLHYSNSSQKGIMVFEDDYDLFVAHNLSQNIGLWVFLSRASVAEENIAQLEAAFQVRRENVPSQYYILHISTAGQTLYEKIIPLLNYLLSLPGSEAKKAEGHLLLAKVYLLARKNTEASKELENYVFFKSQLDRQAKNGRKLSVVQKTAQKLAPPRHRNSPRAVQSQLIEKIQEELLENARQCMLEGNPEDAISLYKMTGSLNPQLSEKSYWYHRSLAESYLKSGMKEEAAGEYSRALMLTVIPKERTHVLDKLIEIRNLSFGYFIWRSKGVCHLRWWSDEECRFSGTIACSTTIKKVLESGLTSDDKCKLSKTKLQFNRFTLGKRIEGFDLVIGRHARLSFYLRINGRKSIYDKITLLPDHVHPDGIPFSLGP